MSYFKSGYSDTELPARARLVYMYLRDRVNMNGVCWPSIRTIGRDLNLSRSTVKRALRCLEEKRWVNLLDMVFHSIPVRTAVNVMCLISAETA